MIDLPHSLARTVVIRAPQRTVFSFFTVSAKWAAWWGAGSHVDPRPGGAMFIKYPGGVEASGEVLEVDPPRRFVFTMGYASNPALPPGGSRVSIALEPHADGTRLTLTHDLPDAAIRDEHRQGWRYQLALFGNVVADEWRPGPRRWSMAGSPRGPIRRMPTRTDTLRRVAAVDVRFRDRYSHVDGIDDPCRTSRPRSTMPGMTPPIRRRPPLSGHGARRVGRERRRRRAKARGTNVFVLDATGASRLRQVSGVEHKDTKGARRSVGLRVRVANDRQH